MVQPFADFRRGSKHAKVEEAATSVALAKAKAKEKQDKEGDEIGCCFIDATFVFFAGSKLTCFIPLTGLVQELCCWCLI